MFKKYKILFYLSIPAILLIIYSLNAGETNSSSKTKHSQVASATKSRVPLDLADNENSVAAILRSLKKIIANAADKHNQEY